ncbi:O-antigen ligase family protein [Rhodococcus opacus]|uniref:O-antigen ligase family protein n=1 Tax=Rhodococcus opacus TaxID=37919 RepID=UPI0029541D9B|nr:O-antigen ligase family protein [Rhodococcus opacus]MDV7088118.1 O-antigen ligase family protein [Rhodococcus opacus]
MTAIAAASLLYLAYVTFGPFWLTVGLVVMSACIVPRNILGASQADYGHAGIAGANPRLTTYGLIFSVLVVAFVVFRVRSELSGWTIAFAAFMSVGMVIWWNASSEQWAGFWQYALVPAGWIVGTALASAVDIHGRSGRTLAAWIAFFVSVQLFVSTAQFFGIPLFTPDASTAEIVGARVNGTLSHPTVLGKVVLLALVLILPLTRSTNATSRFLANVSIIGSLPIFVLAGGRVNLLAVGLLLLGWFILLPKNEANTIRNLIPATLILAFIGSIGMLKRRFQEDPFGENRIHFMGVALDQIQRTPFAGTGPNAYVSTAGQYDALTAEGWPVHNTVLLAIGELGFFGAGLLFVPIVGVALLAWRLRNKPGIGGSYAKAYVALIPGMFLIAMTGWGLLSGEVLPLWFLVTGCVSATLRGSAFFVDTTFTGSDHPGARDVPRPRATPASVVM